MSRGVNKVILVGNVGKDPEVRQTPSGVQIANISLATTDVRKDKQTGQKIDYTEWHRIVFFNRMAEIAGDYIRKGSQVYIEGRIQTNKWKDKENIDRYSTEILAEKMQLLSSREPAKGGRQNTNHNTPPNNQPMGAHKANRTAVDDFNDEDVPF
jgi:single-strand DNA-binding protein